MAKRHSISCSRVFNASDFKKRITVRAVRYSGAAFRCALAAVLAAFFAMPSVSPAARTAVEGDDYELDDKFLYIVDDGRATVAGIYDSPAGGDIAIPSEFNGYPVTAIGENAFSYCDEIVSITVPDSVEEIGEGAFGNCYSLVEISIPDSVTEIGDMAFENCKSLESVVIPGSIKKINQKTFYKCESLSCVTIPDSVEEIGVAAFGACSSLSSLTIPQSVTSIGESAFGACSALKSITVPQSVTSIGKGAFASCTSLESIEVSENSSAYTGKEGVLFTKDMKTLLAFPPGKQVSSYEIPDGVTYIEEYAFCRCDLLESIRMPDSVTGSGKSAFVNCRSLVSVTLSSRLKSISYGMFQGCISLESLTVPDSVEKIEEMAFCFSGLTRLSISGGVREDRYRRIFVMRFAFVHRCVGGQ